MRIHRMLQGYYGVLFSLGFVSLVVLISPSSSFAFQPMDTPTATSTFVATAPTETPTATDTSVATVPTDTPTATSTFVATAPTDTPTATSTFVATAPTETPTATSTFVATAPTETPTATSTSVVTTPTSTPTPSPAAPTTLFVTSRSSGEVDGIKFRDEDIMAFNLITHTWSLVFDGSDVGITKDVDAFSFQSDGSLLLSFNGPTNVPGLGSVDDSDIVRFIPTELGNHTAGSFAWYLHGADVGLTTDSEDIDAIGFTAAGQLIISTIGNFDAPNASGHDEDLFQLNNASFGNPSSGTWSQFFDGSAVDLANEDVNGLWIDPTNNELYLTVKDSFNFGEQHVTGNDIFICTLTQTADQSTCTYRLFWRGDEHNYTVKNLNGIDLGVLPPTFKSTPQAVTSSVANADASDDDSDDLDIVDKDNRFFLPFIEQ